MKTFASLVEQFTVSIAEASGTMEENIMPGGALAPLRLFAKQLSNAFQPELAVLFEKIEHELNKFGYTLNTDVTAMQYGPDDGDDFIIYSVSSGEVVKNVYLAVDWREISGKQFDWTAEGSKLRLDVHAEFVDIDPAELDAIIGDEEFSTEE